MSSIKIIAVPPGNAPEKIRRQWVGIQIPLATEAELHESPANVRFGNQNTDGYIVAVGKAVDALQAANRLEAAEYWNITSMFSAKYLQFRCEVCELIH